MGGALHDTSTNSQDAWAQLRPDDQCKEALAKHGEHCERFADALKFCSPIFLLHGDLFLFFAFWATQMMWAFNVMWFQGIARERASGSCRKAVVGSLLGFVLAKLLTCPASPKDADLSHCSFGWREHERSKQCI